MVGDDNDAFSSANCDGSYTPTTVFSASASNFTQAVSLKNIDCSNGMQDACAAVQNAYECLSGAMDVAQSTAPWPLPPADTASQVNALGGLVREGAATYMTSQALPSPAGFNLSFFNEAISVAGTLITIGQAYDSCTP